MYMLSSQSRFPAMLATISVRRTRKVATIDTHSENIRVIINT